MKLTSINGRTSAARLLTAGLIASLLVMSFASVASADGGGQGRLLSQLRKATSQFRRVSNAQATGYAQFLDCVDEPGQGAMGIHFVNGDFVGDTVLNPKQPEALVYEPGEHGQLKLAALEYIVFQAAWDAQSSAPPMLFGEMFHLVSSPNRYGLPPFYELHVWAWKTNPSGTFYEWNPRVSCIPRGDD